MLRTVAFTLVELLVVISIISILFVTGTGLYFNSREKASLVTGTTQIESLLKETINNTLTGFNYNYPAIVSGIYGIQVVNGSNNISLYSYDDVNLQPIPPAIKTVTLPSTITISNISYTGMLPQYIINTADIIFTPPKAAITINYTFAGEPPTTAPTDITITFGINGEKDNPSKSSNINVEKTTGKMTIVTP